MDLPISKDQFNQGKEAVPLEERVLGFLTKHPDQAYTVREIVQEVIAPNLEDPTEKLTYADHYLSVQISLAGLMKEGKVSGSIVETAGKRDVYFLAM